MCLSGEPPEVSTHLSTQTSLVSLVVVRRNVYTHTHKQDSLGFAQCLLETLRKWNSSVIILNLVKKFLLLERGGHFLNVGK